MSFKVFTFTHTALLCTQDRLDVVEMLVSAPDLCKLMREQLKQVGCECAASL